MSATLKITKTATKAKLIKAEAVLFSRQLGEEFDNADYTTEFTCTTVVTSFTAKEMLRGGWTLAQ